MNRLGLKIGCVVASVLIWVQVAATSDVEQTARLPLLVVGLQEGLTVEGSEFLPATVSVRLRGSKLRLLAHDFFNRYVGEVRVNLADQEPGQITYQILQDDVVTDLEVVRIQGRDRVRLHIDELVERRLPVAVIRAGVLPTGTGFSLAPRSRPDSVLVTGPARFVPSDWPLETLPLDLTELEPGAEAAVTIELRQPHQHVQVAPREVEVVYGVAALEERTLANVPVIPLVDAGRPDVGVSPPVADVMVSGVADSVRALTEADISLTVPVGDRPEGVYLLPADVAHPAGISLLGVVPREFRVIVGDPPLGQPARRDSVAGRAEANDG